jgi:phosphate-selective porin OprO/OprP
MATGLSSFKTEGQITFFTWLGTAVADGTRWRVSPQLAWYVGPVGVLAEYVYSSTTVSTPTSSARIGNQAWQLAASVALTGEHPEYEGLVPARPFDLAKKHFGAVQVAARVDQLFVDEDAFPNFADPTASARRATAVTGQVSWYLTATVRVGLLYEHTVFRGGAPTGDRPVENGFIGRVQVAF